MGTLGDIVGVAVPALFGGAPVTEVEAELLLEGIMGAVVALQGARMGEIAAL